MSRQEKMHRTHRLAYEVLGGAFLILCIVAVGSKFFGASYKDFHMNLFTEAAGIIVTVFVVNRWYAMRDRDRATREHKERLLLDVRYGTNSVAKSAIEVMRKNGWLSGDSGLLKGANLRKADLRGEVNLSDSNLETTNLQEAVLISAVLSGSNLQAADLFMAHLEMSMLIEADLRGAVLMEANLSGAWVVGAKLQGAYLLNAKIKSPFFGLRELQPVFSVHGKVVEYPPTILPDCTEYVQGMSLDRFTDEKHEEFPKTLKDINDIRKRMGLFTVGESTYDQQDG